MIDSTLKIVTIGLYFIKTPQKFCVQLSGYSSDETAYNNKAPSNSFCLTIGGYFKYGFSIVLSKQL